MTREREQTVHNKLARQVGGAIACLLAAALLLSALTAPPEPVERAVWQDCAALGGYAALLDSSLAASPLTDVASPLRGEMRRPPCEGCNPPAYIVTDAEVEALARLLYGEARSCTVEGQAAVIWCVLNRVDSGDPYFADTVMGVVTQPSQFFGYHKDYPVLPELVEVAEDVLMRWNVEHSGIVENPGRVLPREYLYFSGDGAHNYFTREYNGDDVWDWSLWSPYRDD